MKYTKAQIGYHWATVLLVLIMAATGMAYRMELADDGAMLIHQLTGQILIVALALRIIGRIAQRPAPAPQNHSRVEIIAASAMHTALYLTLIAFVFTGYIGASAELDNALIVPANLGFARSDTGEWLLEIHYLLKWVLLVLVGGHIAAALKHHFWNRDSTLSNMSLKAR